MTWLVRIFFGAAGLALLFFGIGLALPSRAQVERSIDVGRPPATVHALVSNLQAFEEWSPWATEEGVERTFAGPPRGTGQTMSVRAADAAAARSTQLITQSTPYDYVAIDMATGAHMRARQFFNITPREGGSRLTWRYDQALGWNIIARYAWTFGHRGSLERAFDAGLANFRDFAESMPGADFSDLEAELVTLESRPVIYVENQMRGDRAQQRAAFERAVDDLEDAMSQAGVRADGPVIAHTMRWEPPRWSFRAARGYEGPRRTGVVGDAAFGELIGGRAVRVIHRGGADTLARLYPKVDAYVAAHRYQASGGRWEITRQVDGAEITEIYVAID